MIREAWNQVEPTAAEVTVRVVRRVWEQVEPIAVLDFVGSVEVELAPELATVGVADFAAGLEVRF